MSDDSHSLVPVRWERGRVRGEVFEEHIFTVGVVDADSGDQASAGMRVVEVLCRAEDALRRTLWSLLRSVLEPEGVLGPHFIGQRNENEVRRHGYFTLREIAQYLGCARVTLRLIARELKVSWNRRLGLSPQVTRRLLAEFHRRRGEVLLEGHGRRTSGNRTRK